MTIREFARAAVGHLTTLLTLAALAGVAVWGMSTGWRLPSPFAGSEPAGESAEGPPPIKVVPAPAGSSDLRARIEFATADDVRRAGFAFAEARTQPLTRYVGATGSIGYDPRFYSQLSSKAAGTLWWVEKVPGQPVARGEVLALIDAAEVGRLKADLLNDLIQLDLQSRNLERLKGAEGNFAVPARTVQETRTAVEAAQARVLSDRQALSNLGLLIDPEELRKLPATDRVDRVRFLGLPESAQSLARGKTESANLLPVVSPFDGFVIRRSISPGEAVAAARPLFVVAGVGQVHLELAVDPRDAGQLKIGQTVLFSPDADPGYEARGRLAHVVPEVDEQVRKVWAHAEADNPTGRLLPNAFGRGRVVIETDPGAVTVPEAAVQRDGDEHLVFVATGDTAFDARRVRPGLRTGGLVAVEGVRPGERVVTTGSNTLAAELRRDQLGGGD